MIPCRSSCPHYAEGCHRTCAYWTSYQRELQDQQRHIQGLEALLAAHGITPPPVPEEEPPQAAVFPARTRETITCPRCGARQRGDRDSCYVCSLPFQYESE